MSRLGPLASTLALALVVIEDTGWWTDRLLVCGVVGALVIGAWIRPRSIAGFVLAPLAIGLAGWADNPMLLGLVATFAVAGLAFTRDPEGLTRSWRGVFAVVCIIVLALALTPGELDEQTTDADEPPPPELVLQQMQPIDPAGDTVRRIVPDAQTDVGITIQPGLFDSVVIDPTAPGFGDGVTLVRPLPPPPDESDSNNWLWVLLTVLGMAVTAVLWRRAGSGLRRADVPVAISIGSDLDRLDALGRSLGHSRGPAEPPLAYGRRLADATGDSRFADVGRLLADEIYRPGTAGGAASALLDELQDSPLRQI